MFSSISAACTVLALVGTYCLIVYHDIANMPRRVRRIGRVAEGTVVELRRDPQAAVGAQQGQGLAPVVEFEYAGGSHRHRHMSVNYQQPCPFQVGQKVVVRFHFYKSIREVLLDGEQPPVAPRSLQKWGMVMCALAYPVLAIRLLNLM